MESPLRAALTPDLKVIETLLWDGGFPRLGAHLDRLAATCRRFGITPGDLGAALALVRGSGPQRVRLTVAATGAVEVTSSPLPPNPPHWHVGLAPERLVSGDPWLGVKTTRRALYDQTRAALPPGLDEMLFLNERGEICEGTITNVFLEAGGTLLTPPLACGLLPGVLRASLLAEGRCREAVLHPQDLEGAPLWVGNALRGLIPARWQPGHP